MENIETSPLLIARRARRLCVAAAAVSVLTYFGARMLLKGVAFEGPLRTIVALAPVPFFLLFLLAEIRLVRNLDELQRRIQLEALAIAFPALLLLLLTLGLLQVAGVALSSQDWSYRHVWIIALALYAAGLAQAEKRYR